MTLALTATVAVSGVPVRALARAVQDPLARVDPELRAGARMILERPAPQWNRETLAMIRSIPPVETPPPPSPATVEQRRAPGVSGHPDAPFELIGARPGAGLRPALIHIHGGGFIVGRVTDTTAMCQSIATELDCVVANVDYRLSPETTFPGPVEDCYAVLAYVHANAEALGVDRTRIAVMGESAGGGLAAMLAISARDRGEIPLCYQVLIYPMLDDRTGSTVRVPDFIGTIGWDEAGNRFGWSSFLGQPAGSPTVPHGAVPARLESVSGLAPAFIGVGGLDLFVDEDIEYARRLVAAGVPTTFHLTPGAYHGFDFIAPESRASRAFTGAWKAALGAAFAPAAAST
ncbi:alpha/beta hydrolase [Brevundimonas sp. R86498]|uniref:alpha/beta hydrolase n=1 Tax=Brevundimonas sp. R86498 TaxID=3093845 RepID=UPI0037C6AF2D